MRLMLLVTSNGYVDRELERVTVGALQEWVERQWDGERYVGNNPLLFWHDERLQIGRIIFSDVHNGFLVEIAEEIDTPLARYLWDAIEGKDGAVSHGFYALETDTSSGITEYTRIEKYETSWLPREAAANNLTIARRVKMNRGEYLAELLQLENADELLEQGVDALVAALEAKNVRHKSAFDIIQKNAQNIREEGKPMSGKRQLLKRRLARKAGAIQRQLTPEEQAQVEEVVEETSGEMIEAAVQQALTEQLAQLVEELVDDRVEELLGEEAGYDEEEEKQEEADLAIRLSQLEQMVAELRGLIEQLVSEEVQMSKAVRPSRRAVRASQSADTIIDLDVSSPVVRQWQSARHDSFWGQALKGGK